MRFGFESLAILEKKKLVSYFIFSLGTMCPVFTVSPAELSEFFLLSSQIDLTFG